MSLFSPQKQKKKRRVNFKVILVFVQKGLKFLFGPKMDHNGPNYFKIEKIKTKVF